MDDQTRKSVEEFKEKWNRENLHKYKWCHIKNWCGGVNFEFLSYCWSFYNPSDGVYPIDGLSLEMMNEACQLVEAAEPDWCGGDTEDRLSACKVLLAKFPHLSNPYDTDD